MNGSSGASPSLLHLSRRPISLWLLLVLGLGLGLFFSAGIFKHIYEALVGAQAAKSIVNAVLLAVVSAYLLGLAIAIQLRRQWIARTLGTLLLLVFAVAAALQPGDPSPNCAPNEACVQGWWFGRILLAALFIAWAVFAGWSPGAKRYYAATHTSGSGEA